MRKLPTCLIFFILSFSLPTKAADWEKGVNQLLSRHGYSLPPSDGTNRLRALEIGAGAAPVSRDQYSLDRYKQFHPGLQLPNMIDGNGHHIPLPAKSLDVIFARNVPEMNSPKAFLKEANRLLRPGGIFFIMSSLHGEIDSLDLRMVHYTDSTLLAHALGYDMLPIEPLALELPNASRFYGFAFIKPLSRAQARANIENPKWKLPKALETWIREGKACEADLKGLRTPWHPDDGPYGASLLKYDSAFDKSGDKLK